MDLRPIGDHFVVRNGWEKRWTTKVASGGCCRLIHRDVAALCAHRWASDDALILSCKDHSTSS